MTVIWPKLPLVVFVVVVNASPTSIDKFQSTDEVIDEMVASQNYVRHQNGVEPL